MGKALWGWACWFVVLFMIDFIVPFHVLNGVQKVTGSFLFWIIWMAVVVMSMFAIFLRWRDRGKEA